MGSIAKVPISYALMFPLNYGLTGYALAETVTCTLQLVAILLIVFKCAASASSAAAPAPAHVPGFPSLSPA